MEFVPLNSTYIHHAIQYPVRTSFSAKKCFSTATTAAWHVFNKAPAQASCLLTWQIETDQGCQMVYFQTKMPIWVNFGGSCRWRCWYVGFMAVWSFSRQLRIFYGHSVYFMVIGYIFTRFGTYVVSRYNMATLKQTTEILGWRVKSKQMYVGR
jgi:hypothetical protein